MLGKISNLKISTGYLLPGFLLIFFAFAQLAYHSYHRFAELSDQLQSDTRNNDQQLSSAMLMRVSVRERALLLWQMSQLADALDRDELFEKFYYLASQYQESRITYMKSDLSAEEQKLLELLDNETNQRAPKLRLFADLMMQDQMRDDFELTLNQILSDQSLIAQLLDQIITLQKNQNETARQDADRALHKLFSELIIWMIIILTGGALFAMMVIRSSKRQQQMLVSANDDLKRLASYDSLTGVPNRMLLMEHLELSLAQSKRYMTQGAILFIDLDDFKPINDNYGHEIGDQYLVAISQVMKEGLRSADLLARLAGDEFVVVLASVTSLQQVENVVKKLSGILSEQYQFGDITIQASASIGITTYPYVDLNVDQLLSRADAAMYRAKQQGKNSYCFAEGESI